MKLLADLVCLENPSRFSATKAAVMVVEKWRVAQWALRLLDGQRSVAPYTAHALEGFEQACFFTSAGRRQTAFLRDGYRSQG